MAILEQCRNRQLSHNCLDIARRFTGDDVEDDDAQGSYEMRKHYYGCIYRLCDLGGTERWTRIELPVCAVAKIRQMYPSADGNYMGFLPE